MKDYYLSLAGVKTVKDCFLSLSSVSVKTMKGCYLFLAGVKTVMDC